MIFVLRKRKKKKDEQIGHACTARYASVVHFWRVGLEKRHGRKKKKYCTGTRMGTCCHVCFHDNTNEQLLHEDVVRERIDCPMDRAEKQIEIQT
jgi:hypothetical protein